VCRLITLNRLGHSDEPFHLNMDMIVTVESTPDTVITLATGAKIVVAETPAEVAAAVHAYRAAVLGDALRRRGGAGGLGPPGPQRQPPLASARGEPPRLAAVEDDPA
jgi:flagellar protein FlbD